MNTLKRPIIGAVIILAIALVLYALRPATTPPTDQLPSETTDQTVSPSPVTGGVKPTASAPKPTTPTAAPKANAMTAALHQQPGTKIVVDSVSLLYPGFIIVQEASEDLSGPMPSRIVATSALIKAGTTKNIVIAATTSPGARYFLTLRTDNSNKIYVPQEDPVARDAADKPISIMITADSPSVTGPQTLYVEMKNLAFTPAALTVKRGDTIYFRNTDIYPHTVTATAFGGRNVLPAGGKYLLNTSSLAPGTYSYRCEYHSPMTGTIVVQ